MKVTHYTPRDAMRSSHRRDTALDRQYSLVDLHTGRELLTLRLYYPGSKCYAVAWVRGTGSDTQGTGSDTAGGYGYCKRSSAAYGALRNAGFTFDECFAGRGEPRIRDAIEAIARHFGLRKRFTIVEAVA